MVETEFAAEPADLRQITDFVDELVVGLLNSRIYWSEHPRVQVSIRDLRALIPTLLARSTEKSLALAIVGEHFVYQQRPLLGASLAAPRLIRAIRERGAGGMEFDAEAPESDFVRFFEILTLTAPEHEDFDRINHRLQERGCSRIRLLPPYRAEAGRVGLRSLGVAQYDASARKPANALVPVELYQGVVDLLQETTIAICHGGLIKFTDARTCIEGVLRNLEEDVGSLFGLSRYERYDAFTFGHSIRVALLALQFARSLTKDSELLNRIGVAALLHDVGKARVPFEVLHCKGGLSPEQRLEMEKHPVYGAEILMDHQECDPMAYTAAFGHHCAGPDRGYPKTLHEHRLSVVTQIVTICDVYEALTAVRPYKPAMSSVRALRIMVAQKERFDPAMLHRFICTIGAYPTGTLVRLSSGDMARVRGQTAHIQQPIVETVLDQGGRRLTEGERRTVDLSQGAEAPLAVTEVLLDTALEHSLRGIT